MYWKLTLNQQVGKIELWKDADCVAERTWREERHTSQDILNALQEIKTEQGIAWNDVPKFQLALDLPPSATARRIAESFQKVYTVFVA